MIYGTNELAELCVRFPNLRVLVSISNASAKRKHQIIENLQAFPVQVVSIPPLNEIADGTARVENLQEIDIQDLLGRDSVPPIEELFHQALQGKTVFVSGAGGSIGSEICSQIAANHPKLIIAVDNSELALYGLQQKLISKMHEEGIESNVEFKLADITNEIAVRHLIKSYKPDVVYHAAAYKHVPIAEKNILSTIQNNVLGTYSFANICAEEKVRHFILISTDKAVRPTNVMGASKRLAELVIQMMHQSHKNTIFSMVRFGNVLGSSGSVIPLFRKQIEAGGPVTVTHPKVIRFFMTITEAAQLVIQSGFISKGGDVFVLDMGEQITIDQLARLMIQLSGKTVRDKDHPNGDIEIVYTGLRPGEKLYEELLIGDNPEATIHPKIMVANETSIKKPVLQKNLRSLQNHIAVQDAVKAITVMEQLVEGFKYKNGKTLPDDSCN
ncbi:MAG: nucleoside-diphosphate sugar epimerase/dehydratase [Pseudomonadota bacterium]